MSGWIDRRQAEEPGQPSWTPPELTCEFARMSPSRTPTVVKIDE